MDADLSQQHDASDLNQEGSREAERMKKLFKKMVRDTMENLQESLTKVVDRVFEMLHESRQNEVNPITPQMNDNLQSPAITVAPMNKIGSRSSNTYPPKLFQLQKPVLQNLSSSSRISATSFLTIESQPSVDIDFSVASPPPSTATFSSPITMLPSLPHSSVPTLQSPILQSATHLNPQVPPTPQSCNTPFCHRPPNGLSFEKYQAFLKWSLQSQIQKQQNCFPLPLQTPTSASCSNNRLISHIQTGSYSYLQQIPTTPLLVPQEQEKFNQNLYANVFRSQINEPSYQQLPHHSQPPQPQQSQIKLQQIPSRRAPKRKNLHEQVAKPLQYQQQQNNNNLLQSFSPLEKGRKKQKNSC